MPVSQDILPVIPVGEENAVTAQLLWKQLNLWSFASIKHKLNEMAAAGLIERKRVSREGQRVCILGVITHPPACRAGIEGQS